MDGASVDLDEGIAVILGKTIVLTPRECEILYVLLEEDRWHSASEVLDRVWGSGAPQTPATVSMLVGYVRKKLVGSGLEIQSRWGHGYRAVLGC